MTEPEDVARRFHETYERLAPSFGYETRPESAVPWEQVPENNRALMAAVVGEVLSALITERDAIERNFLAAETEAQQLRGEVDRLREAVEPFAQYASSSMPPLLRRIQNDLRAALSASPPEQETCPRCKSDDPAVFLGWCQRIVEAIAERGGSGLSLPAFHHASPPEQPYEQGTLHGCGLHHFTEGEYLACVGASPPEQPPPSDYVDDDRMPGVS